jgi:hypothetical protein
MIYTTKNRHSTAYRFTVKMIDGKVAPEDQSSVNALRTGKNSNEYVKLQGRGARPSRRYHQALPLSMSTSADVYIYNR